MPKLDAISAQWFEPQSVAIIDEHRLLRSWLSNRQIARLAGAPRDSEVVVSLVGGNVELRVRNRILSEDMVRLLVQNDEQTGYSCHIVNSVFVLDANWHSRGIGARSVAIEIFQAALLGVVIKIVTYAIGDYRAFLAQNMPLRGYYVWAAMGFDAPLPQATLDAVPATLKNCRKVVPPAVDWTLICSSCGLPDGIRLPDFKG